MRTHTCPPDHAHGRTPTCYRSHKCGCTDCNAANNARCRTRKRLIAIGAWNPDLVPTGPIRDHLCALRRTGMSRGAIAKAAGVDGHCIRDILRGNRTTGRIPERITTNTATRILSIPLDLTQLPDHVLVPARSARRRLQALGARGWSGTELASRLGIPEHRVGSVHRAERVPAWLHRDIVALYERLWDAQPPTATITQRKRRSRALTTARRHGWAPPLAWDDIDTDTAPPQADDEPVIDDVAIELALSGHHVPLTRDERIEATRRGTERGRSETQLAELLGVDARTIARDRGTLNEKAA